MKEDITQLVLEFREAIKNLWNNHAHKLDGDHRFAKIEEDYFYYSVLFQSDTRISGEINSIANYYKYVIVKPVIEAGSQDLLLGRKNSSGGYDFEFVELGQETGLDLRFIQFTDLGVEGVRDYKYAMAYILNSDNLNLKDCVLLLESEKAHYIGTNA